MRIAIFMQCSPAWGGSYQYALNLCKSIKMLQSHGHQFRIFVSHKKSDIYFQQNNIAFTYLSSVFMVLCSKIFRCFLRLFPVPGVSFESLVMRIWGADVCLHAQQGVLFNIIKPRQVCIIHDLMHRYETSFPEACAPDIYTAREQASCEATSIAWRILVDSELGKRHVIDSYHIADDKVCVLPFCINDDLLNVNPKKPQALRFLPDTYIFYPAQFWKHKNHINLLSALSLLTDIDDIHCVFVGKQDKNGYDDCVQYIEMHNLQDKIQILGYVSSAEIVWLYKNARCCVMPTFFGPTNIPPLEAMYLGCPVAVSNNYAMPEQLGDAALYFSPSSTEEIAGAIRSLWTDEILRAALIDNGYKVVKNKTNADFAKKLCTILEE